MQPFPTLRTITADLQDDVLVVRVLRPQMLDDRIDEMRRECAAVVAAHRPASVVLDLSQVAMISSLGVTVVISLLKQVRERGGDLVLCGLSVLVERVFRLCQLVADDHEEAALRAYRGPDHAVAALRRAA